MSKILIVIDMQNDFIDGALGTNEAVAIVPKVRNKIQEYKLNNNAVIYTRDTHADNYLQTQEGINLPVPHCIKDTYGWQVSKELMDDSMTVIDKPTFGSTVLAEMLKNHFKCTEVELIGLCTDICVISNALLIKAHLPEVKITVDASCCAGVTPKSHRNALTAMKMCQISIINE